MCGLNVLFSQFWCCFRNAARRFVSLVENVSHFGEHGPEAKAVTNSSLKLVRGRWPFQPYLGYPLENRTMENRHFSWENPL